MYLKYKYLLFFLIAIAIACNPNKNNMPTPIAPVGNFSGQFTKIRLNAQTGKTDTLNTYLDIKLDTMAGYKVWGDTAKVHAGSYGTYTVHINSYIQFNDKTFPLMGYPSKVHLAGIYEYYYDGTTFQMLYVAPFDTLSFRYNLKKVN